MPLRGDGVAGEESGGGEAAPERDRAVGARAVTSAVALPAVLRRVGLLTTRRHGRYVHYSLNLPELTTLGTDLLVAVLR